MTKAQINRAIRHTGLTIEGTRGDLYFYFLNASCDQIGESVLVAYLRDLSLTQWVEEAEAALREHGGLGNRVGPHKRPSREPARGEGRVW
jgi:hypothetical protein